MRSSVFIIATFVFASQGLEAQEMKTIESFFAENNQTNDKSLQSFVGMRCSSFYFVMAAMMKLKNQINLSKKFEILSNFALEFALDSGFNDKNYVASQVSIMSAAYIDLIKKSQALTGNSFDNPILVSDGATCQNIFIKKD